MTRYVFHLIPHTHWDREWYLPRAAFEARLVGMLDELVAMLEGDRGLRFTLDGQTILLEDYFGVRPSMRSRIARLARRGQLAVGPWYVLADELIPTAESLRKNLALGLADARALGGAMRVLYSPDAFGHPHDLPDLAAAHGVRWGVIWRGLAGSRVEGPDLYRWQGPGGGSLIIHHLPPEGYEVGAHLPGAGPALGAAWAPLRERLVARSLTRHVAVPIGADHHAAHPALPGLLARLRRLDPGHAFRWSRWEDYFRGAVRARPRLHVLRGELRRSDGAPWVLQGVHGTRPEMKRRHALVEYGLTHHAEPLVRRTAARSRRGRSALLEAAWRRLLQCQFHDSIAGTVCRAAAEEQDVRLESVAVTCDELVRECLFDRIGHDPDRARARGAGRRPALVVWNPPGRRRSGVVTGQLGFFRRDVLVGPPSGRVPGTGPGLVPFALRAPSGRMVPVQVLGVERGLEQADARYHYPDLDEVDRVAIAFDPAPLRPDEARVYEVVETGRWLSVAPSSPVAVLGRRIENALVSVAVARNGTLTLTDRQTGERYGGLLGLVDERDRGDLYTPRTSPDGRRSAAVVVRGIDRPAGGPLVGGIAVRWRLRSAGRGSLSGVTTVTLAAGSPWVTVRVRVDDRAHDHRLRLRLPLGFPPESVVVGPAPRQIHRAVHGPGPVRAGDEWPLATAPAHDRLVAGRGQRGLVLAAPGFFEYELAGSDLLVTVSRVVGALSRADLPGRPGHAAWPAPVPPPPGSGAPPLQFALTPFSHRRVPDPGWPDRLAIGLADWIPPRR